MAIYNIPVEITGTLGKTGIINLPNYTGNTINATWADATLRVVTVRDNTYVTIMGSFKQNGITTVTHEYEHPGIVYKKGTVVYTKMPIGALVPSSSGYQIYVEDYFESEAYLNSFLGLDIKDYTVEKPQNFSHVGNKQYEDITISCTMTSSNKLDYEVIQDDTVILSVSDTTSKTILIKKGTLKTANPLKVCARSTLEFGPLVAKGEWAEYTISSITPVIAEKPQDLRIVGIERAIENELTFAWFNAYTNNLVAKIEFWQNGIKKYESNNLQIQQFALPGGTLKTKDALQVRVYNTKTINGYSATSDYSSITISDLVSIAPNLTDFILSGTNRDYDITVIPTCTGADKYRINGIDGLVIPTGTLAFGNNTLVLDAIKVSENGNEIITQLNKVFVITQDTPAIYSLEPDRVNSNIDNDVPVTFVTNEFCDRWELSVNDGRFISGTDARKHIIAGGTLKKGQNVLRLTSYYTAPWGGGLRSSVKEVTFTGYGKPTIPTLDPVTVYNTATPFYKWLDGSQDSDKQVSFHLKVYKDTVLIEEKISDIDVCEYKGAIALENNTLYTLKVRIKNRYNIWSDYAVKTFNTSFNELPKPILRLDVNNDTVLVSVDGVLPTNFTEVRIFRKTELEKNFTQIANKIMLNSSIVDYTIPTNTLVSYKARIYDNTGSYSESDIATAKVYLQNYKLSNVEAFTDCFSLNFATASYQYTSNEVIKHFKNANDPVVFSDNSRSISVSITAEMSDFDLFRLEQLLERSKVLCFRDRRGRKYYVYAKINDAKPINATNQQITMSLVKVNFIETNMYCTDGFKRLVFLNGEYFLDGSLDLSGFEV